MWAIGVITYFLLCGYTPFDRDTQQEEMQAIINRDFKFEPGAPPICPLIARHDLLTHPSQSGVLGKCLRDGTRLCQRMSDGRPDVAPHRCRGVGTQVARVRAATLCTRP